MLSPRVGSVFSAIHVRRHDAFRLLANMQCRGQKDFQALHEGRQNRPGRR
jgi:hypothetical protein